ncbi:sensor histidine kinase [Salininema proteolyticum]|uniref:histidine kinase n=1 Tax=Salininema proteolyticum TaxID=1607685 RepID=A0ABV8U095_9ACTN
MSKRTTLAGRLMVFQAVVVFLVLTAVGALSMAQSEAVFLQAEGRRVSALAEQMADSPLVRGRIDVPGAGDALAPLVQRMRTQSNVSTVAIADAEGRVVVSTNPLLAGTELEYGHPSVPDGRGWLGELRVDGDLEYVSQVPVLDASPGAHGRVLGTIMVGQHYPTLWDRLFDNTPNLLLYLGVASAIGITGSYLLARRIKRQTLGMEPREIAGLAEHREAMLHGIAEGVVALDEKDRVTLVNDTARTLLDLPADPTGRALDDLGLSDRVREVLSGRAEGRDLVVLHGQKVLTANRMEVVKEGRALGSVTTLRDRTALVRLEKDLGAFRSATDVLRAQKHEFDNRLHVISGLAQLGEYEEVATYIRSLGGDRSEPDFSIARAVADKSIAALLMAKAAQASEHGTRLVLAPGSSLGALAPDLAADVGTVLGNLVDNALDAVASSPDPRVTVAVSQTDDEVSVTVADSGPGVAPEIAREVFTHGFTTKAAASGARGIGLALTRLVCRQRGGDVVLDSSAAGARLTATVSTAPLPPQPNTGPESAQPTPAAPQEVP